VRAAASALALYDAAGTAGLYVVGGNVGIGTTGPGAKLDVVGIVRGDSYYHIKKDKPAAAGENSTLWQTNAAVSAEYWSIGTQGYGTGNVASLALRTGNVNDYVLLQPAGGNVGIGTTAPAHKLSVAGKANFALTGGSVTIADASASGTLTGASGYIVMWIAGATRYIPCYTAVA